MTLAYRPADERDLHFIGNAWAGTFAKADTAGAIQAEDWYAVMIPQIAKMRARPDVRTTVAYETTDLERVADIYGFIVADVTEHPALVYYVFVKTHCRRSGVARGLFEAIGIDPRLPFNFVCSTPWVSKLQRKIPLARWTPLRGRFTKSERRAT